VGRGLVRFGFPGNSPKSFSSLPEDQLNRFQIEDLQLAPSKLLGASRLSLQTEKALKYCRGSARLTETVFGWGRNNVELGLAEKRTGMTCIGAQAAFGGAKR
jgi:hypothetical protein